jgi:phosphatidylglycerol lysyltransferase
MNRFLKSVSSKIPWKEILALLILLLAVLFFRGERKELSAIIPEVKRAGVSSLAILLSLSAAIVILQGGMYRYSFAATGRTLTWLAAIQLFLKRNFLGVFLPAGSVSALAYSPSQLRKAGFTAVQIHQSSALFAFAGLVSVFIVGIPVVIYTQIHEIGLKNAWAALVFLFVIIVLIVYSIRSLKQKGWLYRSLIKKFPSVAATIDELFGANVRTGKFLIVILCSIGIELLGMVIIYVSMRALDLPISFEAAAAAYIIGILMGVLSPFLRGLGAVELSMVYILGQFGYTEAPALSITLLYRSFEFWLPLLAGFISFAWKGKNLLLRAFPALLTFALGIINLVSVITPPTPQRLRLIRQYMPIESVHASNMLVLFAGMALVVTATFLFRGIRNAWIVAVTLAVLSLTANLTRALDYEESILAFITLIVLLLTSGQYPIRSSRKWMKTGIRTAAIVFVSVITFGFITFYFVDKRHFGVDFAWYQSLVHTLKSFLLIDDSSLHPVTGFGLEITWALRFLGFFTWGFFFFSLIRPQRRHVPETNEEHRREAQKLLEQFGQSPLDYFKTYKDKLIFLSENHEAFVAYRIASGFAIVLEEPVCAPEHKTEVLQEFELQCRKMGLKTAFYRVDENGIPSFNALRKQKLMIGQEAIIDTNLFTLEGKERKSLRNGLNALQKKGYTVDVYHAPQSKEFIQELRKVSDEWLQDSDVEETVFSQGMFDEQELQQQDIIAVKDSEGHVKAFLNILPDFAGDDCTYDLIRKTADSPGAGMDALIIRLVTYAKDHGKQYVNLGLAPMTGITAPDNTAERIMVVAADRIRRFRHYKGLREFKEKYASLWENKYLVYSNDFDLLQLPGALSKVIKP